MPDRKKVIKGLTSKITFDTTITNLNDTSLAGGHYFYEASATGNPSTTAGRLIQIKSSGSSWGGQIAVPNSTAFLMFARMKTSSGYGDWEQLAIGDFSIKITDVVTSSFRVHRSGNVVFAACLGGNRYSCDSNGGDLKYDDSVISIPVGYRPLYGADVRDTLQNRRISIANTGAIAAGEAFTTSAVRFTTCWMTSDAYPT